MGCIFKKIFSDKIGQNEYQNAQNFILIPNLKTKLRKIKIYLENLAKGQFFVNNFLDDCYFLILPSDLESVLNSAFLGTHIDLFEEKSVQLY